MSETKCVESGVEYGSDEMWRILRPKVVAVAVNRNGIVYGYEGIPSLNEGLLTWGPPLGRVYSYTGIVWKNLPDWRDSLRIRPASKKPELTFEDWRAEYYPVEASEMVEKSWEECLDHAIKCWEGRRKEVLEKYGLKIQGWVLHNGCCPVLSLSRACALCSKARRTPARPFIAYCSVCPIYLTTASTCNSTWHKFVKTGDPEPMIVLLKRVREEYGKPKRGSDEWWAAAPDWAKWAATDSDGDDFWYRDRPIRRADCGFWLLASVGSAVGHIGTNPTDNWRDSLIRRPFRWREPDENTPVDTLVWVRAEGMATWALRYYSRPGHAWFDGATSKTTTNVTRWRYMVLANPDDLEMKPPEDWGPTKGEKGGSNAR